MNKTKINLLKEYIKNNISPILIDFIDGNSFPDSIILNADIDKNKLNGHYENIDFVAPDWYYELKNKQVLVINNIDSISKEDQLKFVELLKYRKISIFELPENIVIIITANKINKDTINEKIYSLVAHIGE